MLAGYDAMGLAERIGCYRELERLRGRPLIVYATSTRQNASGMMASDAVREFIDQIDRIPGGDTEVDVLIHSNGGDALTAWKLMSLLRERFAKVGVLVPCVAFSAATVFSLGADEIVMHPHASLGPIDPQIVIRQPNGVQKAFAYEDVAAFLAFLTDEAGLTEQKFITEAALTLFQSVDPLSLGASSRASHLATEVGRRLLRLHIQDEQRAEKIAKDLNKAFFAHGDAVSRSRAHDLGLPIADRVAALEAAMWTAFLGLEDHMQLREPFKPHQVLFADVTAGPLLLNRPGLNIPVGTPPQVVQQIMQAVLNNALGPAARVRTTTVAAVIESVRLASEVSITQDITGSWGPTGLEIAATEIDGQWREVPLPSGDVTE